MAVEVFANLAETTLASGYTSGGASFSVTSAALFPTTGTFGVVFGNSGPTIYRVDSVAGTVFTGGAEANDANASAGDTVKLIGTRRVAERFLQAPDSGESRAPSGVSGVDFYGPIYLLSALDQSAWSWVNQGTATVSQASGLVYFRVPTNASANVRGRFVTAPATPWTRTIIVNSNPILGNVSWGLWLRESATSKLVSMCFRTPSADTRPLLSARKYSSETSFSSQTELGPIVPAAVASLRVADDGTNISLAYSFDGLNFETLLSETRATFFTTAPNQFGIAAENFSGSTIGFSILSLSDP